MAIIQQEAPPVVLSPDMQKQMANDQLSRLAEALRSGNGQIRNVGEGINSAVGDIASAFVSNKAQEKYENKQREQTEAARSKYAGLVERLGGNQMADNGAMSDANPVPGDPMIEYGHSLAASGDYEGAIAIIVKALQGKQDTERQKELYLFQQQNKAFPPQKPQKRPTAKNAAGYLIYTDDASRVDPSAQLQEERPDFGNSVEGNMWDAYNNGPSDPRYESAVKYLSEPRYVNTPQGFMKIPAQIRPQQPAPQGAPPPIEAGGGQEAPQQPQPTSPVISAGPEMVQGTQRPTARQEQLYATHVDKMPGFEEARASLVKAMELSPTAFEGPTANERTWASRNIPGADYLPGFGKEGAHATNLMETLVGKQWASKLRASLGAQFTQREGEVLRALEGSAELSHPERMAVWGDALEMIDRRLGHSQNIVTNYEKIFGNQYSLSGDPEKPQPQTTGTGQPGNGSVKKMTDDEILNVIQ